MFDLAEGRITIGRAPDNSISLDHTTVSKYHAMLVKNGSDYKIFDFHSTNGTHVNDKPVVVTTLRDGDQVRLGDVTLRYESNAKMGAQPVASVQLPPEPAPAAPPPAQPAPVEAPATSERTQRIPLPFSAASPLRKAWPPASPQPQKDPAPEKPAPAVTVIGTELRSTPARPTLPAQPMPTVAPKEPLRVVPREATTDGETVTRPESKPAEGQFGSMLSWALNKLQRSPKPPTENGLVAEQRKPVPVANAAPVKQPAVEPSPKVQGPTPAARDQLRLSPVEKPLRVEFKSATLPLDQKPREVLRVTPGARQLKDEIKKPEPAPKPQQPPSPIVSTQIHEPSPAIEPPTHTGSGKKRGLYAAFLAVGLLVMCVGYPIGAQSFKFLGLLLTVTSLLCLIFDLKYGSLVAPPRNK